MLVSIRSSECRAAEPAAACALRREMSFLFAAASVVLQNRAGQADRRQLEVSIRSSECRAAEPARQKAHSRRRAVSIRSSECRAAEQTEEPVVVAAPSFYSQQQVSCCRTRTMRLPLKVARLVSIRSSECRAAQPLHFRCSRGWSTWFLFAAASVVLHNKGRSWLVCSAAFLFAAASVVLHNGHAQ